MRRLFAASLLAVMLAGCSPQPIKNESLTRAQQIVVPPAEALKEIPFGDSVAYKETPVSFASGLGQDFSLDEITNLDEMQQAYGITFTEADKKALADRKFVMKRLTDTTITPSAPPGPTGSKYRELVGLYRTVSGMPDPRDRTQANAIFLTPDVLFNSYNVLYTELLKEMENTVFSPAMKTLSQKFYEAAAKKVETAPANEKVRWTKVRNYFAVPYTLLSNATSPLSAGDYNDPNGGMRDPAEVQSEFAKKDATVDTIETATAFVKGLKLDTESETAVLTDMAAVFKASDRAQPAILADEYKAYAESSGIEFQVDFSQFTPRSHYTGSSLRRQYFRSIMWFSQVPFFLKSPELTDEAFAMSQLFAENPEQLKDYSRLESAINFLVGESDDLMPVDYLRALASAKASNDPEKAIMSYLTQARNPKIKGTPAEYKTVGEVTSDQVLLATKGMRFFSGKFIIDSYWTGQLTQGDEAIKPGYTQKLPPMASAVEVMTLLGSDYARQSIPLLDFYKPETKEAIDQAMADLTKEETTLTQADWTSNLYNGWLWTIQSLFDWREFHRDELPRFMQSTAWAAKTLMTGTGFWTDLRHATLLYAKQSYAEMGAGPPPCDSRPIPEAPKGYIEPDAQAYDRLLFLAQRTEAGLKEQGFDTLSNFGHLGDYIAVLQEVQQYVVKELKNQSLTENVKDVHSPDPWDEGKDCLTHEIDGQSDWEILRKDLTDKLGWALPEPLDGPILAAKDQRAALVADVHTGGDSKNPTRILYEGNGVPNVIFVAVKDTNGARLTVGFTYAPYEFTELAGGKRMTDEDWQTKFYTGDDIYRAFEYTPAATWPAVNPWFELLFTK